MIEQGIPNYESTGWYGVLVPAGTPKTIIMRLNTAIVDALNLPDLKERVLSQGGDATPSTPEQFAAFIADELKKWTTVIRTTNIQIE